jgi:ABC-2 type transport system permease protein
MSAASVARHRTPQHRLLAAELLKVRSTRVVWGLLVGALAVALLNVVIVIAGHDASSGRLDSADAVRRIFISAGSGSIFVLALGILSTAGELRHGTAVQAFLAVPTRVPVLVAKVGACALLGLVLGEICATFCVAVALPWTAAEGEPIALGDREMWRVLSGVMLGTMLYGALGVGIGSLVRNQVTALLVAIGWFVVVESALLGAIPEVAKWLPGGAAAGLSGGEASGKLLPMGWAGALLAGYAATFVVAGIVTVNRREVGA